VRRSLPYLRILVYHFSWSLRVCFDVKSLKLVLNLFNLRLRNAPIRVQ